jgi:DNA-binding NtrC family response regulator
MLRAVACFSIASLTVPTTDSPKSATVLLVDDDPVILRAHVRWLNGEFSVETCDSGSAADRRVEAGGIDVVVSDVSMPGMTGFELLGAIRRRDLHLPVILASALSACENADEAIGNGAFVYLPKPVHPATFRAAVRLAVQYRRTARASPSTRPSAPPES